jgi:hypothetical protein
VTSKPYAGRGQPLRCPRCGTLDLECGHVPKLAPSPVVFKSYDHRMSVYESRAAAGYRVLHPADVIDPPPALPPSVLLDETYSGEREAPAHVYRFWPPRPQP